MTFKPSRQRHISSSSSSSALTPFYHHQRHQPQPSHTTILHSFLSMAPSFNVPSSVIKPTRHHHQQPQIRRSFILFTVCFSLIILFFSQLSSPPFSKSTATTLDKETTASASSEDDALRYSEAAAHFRKSLTPEQLEQYFKRREEALRSSTSKSSADDSRPLIFASNISSPYFNACFLSSDTSVLHPSLRRGPDTSEISGRASAKQPRDFDDVFSTIDRRRYYFNADRTSVQTVDYLGAGLDSDLDDAIRISTAVAQHDVDSDSVTSIDVPVSYMRTTRQEGWQAVINLGGIAMKNGSSVHFRRMVTVTRGYGTPCETSLVRPREMVRINVVVPYSNRPHRLTAFVKMFSTYFASTSSYTEVRIIVSTTKEEVSTVNNTIRRHTAFVGENEKRAKVVISEGDEFGNFSRAVAIRDAVIHVPTDEVIFIADADLVLGANFFQNCRVNIVRGSQVYFPIMFSLYPYGKGLSSRDGLWRRSSYGMVCLYKSDFDAVGGFGPDEEEKFSGWGSEDVFLYNRFRDSKKFAVFRALETGLQHQWHGKDCERNEHYVNCMRTVYMTIGSQDAIAKLMVDARVDISNLTKNALPV